MGRNPNAEKQVMHELKEKRIELAIIGVYPPPRIFLSPFEDSLSLLPAHQ